MTNPTDPAADVYRFAASSISTDDAVALIQSYGDQRVAEERERVVKWLRGRQEIYRSEYAVSVDPAVRDIADAIEQGDYLAPSSQGPTLRP